MIQKNCNELAPPTVYNVYIAHVALLHESHARANNEKVISAAAATAAAPAAAAAAAGTPTAAVAGSGVVAVASDAAGVGLREIAHVSRDLQRLVHDAVREDQAPARQQHASETDEGAGVATATAAAAAAVVAIVLAVAVVAGRGHAGRLRC